MEFSDKLLVEFSDKKGCLMTLYSDASVELKILTVILIVERIQASHVYFYFMSFTRRIYYITIIFYYTSVKEH